MKLQRLDYTVLIVSDLERSLAFYLDILGLPLNHRTAEYAQLATGVTRLSLYSREAMQETLGRTLLVPDTAAPAFELGFRVEDVDAAYDELVSRGVPGVTPPHTRPWGQRTAYVQDPDGVLIELVQDPKD